MTGGVTGRCVYGITETPSAVVSEYNSLIYYFSKLRTHSSSLDCRATISTNAAS